MPGSRPGTPGQPEVVKSNVEIMSEKWNDATDTDGKLGVLFEMLIKTMKAHETFQDDVAHSNAIQAAKDDAQDEIMQMEFDSYDRKLSNVLKYKDLSEAVNMMDAQQKSLEVTLNRKVMENQRHLGSHLDMELEKVSGSELRHFHSYRLCSQLRCYF